MKEKVLEKVLIAVKLSIEQRHLLMDIVFHHCPVKLLSYEAKWKL